MSRSRRHGRCAVGIGVRPLNIEEFTTLTEAQVIVEDWRIEYNNYRPHSSLGMLTPVEFTQAWSACQHEDTEPALS